MNPLRNDTTSPAETRPRKRISYVRWTVSLLLMIPLVFIWALFLKGGLLNFELISGSMEPTLRVGDRVLVDTSRLPDDLRGLVVCLRAPEDAHQLLAKRVVAQEGDTIRIRSGEFYLNSASSPLEGDVVDNFRDQKWEVGSGEVFVLGDNRNNSNDSKHWGPISREQVVGQVWLRYWPLSEFGRIY